MYLISPVSSPSSVLASSSSGSFPGAGAVSVRTSKFASEQEQRLGFGHDFVSRSTLASKRGNTTADDGLCWAENRSRRDLLLVSLTSYSSMLVLSSASGKVKGSNPYNDKRLLEQNKKIQAANNAPDDFPNFVREGFQVKVVTSDNYLTTNSGLIYLDILVGKGDCPKEGQQVTFHYVGYNESGRRIDSTYLQDRPAKIRLGNKSLVPGFEEGIRDMRPGGKRRIIIPPELGPPVGPSTFFSAKQFEVFDIELLDVKDCQRRTIGFYSDVVCN